MQKNNQRHFTRVFRPCLDCGWPKVRKSPIMCCQLKKFLENISGYERKLGFFIRLALKKVKNFVVVNFWMEKKE